MATSSGLGDLTAIACDDTGRLFAAVQAPDGSTRILVTDVFAAVLAAGHDVQAIPLDPSSLDSVTLLHPSTPVRHRITSMAASPDGHRLLLLGTEPAQDTPLVLQLDVYGSEPDFQATAAAAATLNMQGSQQQQQHQLTPCVRVHAALHRQRPGLRVLQAAWHPLSHQHFALLSSDNAWRLYSATQPATPEQELLLRPQGAPAPSKLGLAARLTTSRSSRIVRFAWGPAGGRGWAPFALLLCAGNGKVYCCCPVVPFGLRVAGSTLQKLLEGGEGDGLGQLGGWLQAAFPDARPEGPEQRMRHAYVCRPHMTETAAPALQGPLDLEQQQQQQGGRLPKGVAATALAVTKAVAATPGTTGVFNSGVGGLVGAAEAAAVLVGFNSGQVLAYALDLQQLQPCWCPSLPQCVYDSRGDVASVRYECDAVALVAGRDPEEEDGWGGEQQQQQQQQQGVVAAAGPLLLLDQLMLRLQQGAEEQPGGGRPSRGLFPVEEEGDEGDDSSSDADSIQSDAAYDPDAPPRQQLLGGAPGSPVQRQQQQLAGGGGRAPPLLHLLQLLPSPEAADRAWVVSDQGAWGLHLPWLPQLAQQLQQGVAGSGLQQAAAAAEEEGEAGGLLPPRLQELQLASGRLIGSAVVASPLMGAGALTLEAAGTQQQQQQQLVFLRLRLAAATPSSNGGDAAAAAGGGGGGAADAVGAELAALGLGGSSQQQQAAAVQQVEDFYAEVRAGPRRLPPLATRQPTGGEGGGGEDEAAAAVGRLAELVQRAANAEVPYISLGHNDLAQRASQLLLEVGHQKAVVGGLQGYAAALAARSTELGRYVSDLSGRQANLAQRLALLQQMHWALPRAASEAEKGLGGQLQVWEGQHQQLQATWQQLAARLAALKAKAPPAATPPAAARSPLTPTSTHNGATAAARRLGGGGFTLSSKTPPVLLGSSNVRRHLPGGAAPVRTPVTPITAAAAAARGGSLLTPGGGGGGEGGGGGSDAGLERLRGALEGLLVLVGGARRELGELAGELEEYQVEAVLQQQAAQV